MSEKKFEQWCLVELMGHQKIAGLCSEQTIAGTNMLRVDVPETADEQAFTRFYSSSAIYAIHPMDEETTRGMAGKFQQKPITIWELQEFINKKPMQLVGGESSEEFGDEEDLPY